MTGKKRATNLANQEALAAAVRKSIQFFYECAVANFQNGGGGLLQFTRVVVLHQQAAAKGAIESGVGDAEEAAKH